MALTTGTTFGVFQIAARIGGGGMGEVYRARDTRLDRDVALKVLPDALTQDHDRIARFEREARTLASLNHPHIAHVYGLEHGPVSEVPGTPTRAIVMELVEGEDLSDRIARGTMSIAEIVSIARQIAEAIGSAHEAGIVHRDLKPSNIRIRRRRHGQGPRLRSGEGLRVACRRRYDGDRHRLDAPQGRSLLGTAAYMSPEQARGQAVDARTDIWSFGCVLYEMLARRLPFPGATTSDIVAKFSSESPTGMRFPPRRRRACGGC